MTFNDKQKNIILILILIFIILLSICIGSANITPITIIKVLSNNILDTNFYINPNQNSIIWFIRLPRILAGVLCGFSLSVCGLVLQSLLKNPIATPYTLGVSTGASLGIAFPIFLGITLPVIPSFTYTFFAFLGGLLSIILLLILVRSYDDFLSNTSVIIIGMVMSMTLSGLLSLLTSIYKDKAQVFIFWQMGSLSSIEFSEIWVMFIISITCITLIYLKSSELDIFTQGEHSAKILGVNTQFNKIYLIIITTILTGAIVATSGIIGFIGLVSSHIARKKFYNKHNVLIISSGLIGAILLVISDTVARTIMSPIELPVGAITALIGGPFFAYIFLSKRVR